MWSLTNKWNTGQKGTIMRKFLLNIAALLVSLSVGCTGGSSGSGDHETAPPVPVPITITSDPVPTPVSVNIPVLLYHQIRTDADVRLASVGDGETVIYIETFRAQMRWLHDNGYQTLRLQEFRDVISRRRSLTQKSVVLTFDDGWESQLQIIPILQEVSFHAIFPVLIGPPESGDPLYMSFADFLFLDRHLGGFDVIGHTITHPDLVLLWNSGMIDQVNSELSEPRRVIRAVLGHDIDAMAFPYGSYNDALVALAQKFGYNVLFTVDPGFNTTSTSLLGIHRSVVDGRCGLSVFINTLQTGDDAICGP